MIAFYQVGAGDWCKAWSYRLNAVTSRIIEEGFRTGRHMNCNSERMSRLDFSGLQGASIR